MAITIQLRGGTAAEWTSANPVLAEREMGIETNTGFFKIGNGTDTWSALPYNPLRLIDDAEVINFDNQLSHPTTPAANTLNLYAKEIAGRMMLRQQGPSGIYTPLQPSFFQNNITMINAGSGTALNIVGTGITSVGTVSHPVVNIIYGHMANIATGASAGNTAGTGSTALMWIRGANTSQACGFFYNARIAFPDSNYNNTGASTGSRFFAGFTNQTMAASVGSDNPAGHRVGFSYINSGSGIQDSDFMISSRGGSTEERFSTGLPFIAENVYDLYLFCPPTGNEITWRIDNVTADTTAQGVVINHLPDEITLMRHGIQLCAINAGARNIRMQRIYCESDR